MKKLILAVLAMGTLALGPIQAGAHGGGFGGGYGYHGGWGYGGYRGGWGWGGFGYGAATGFVVGSALASPWYYSGYYGPSYGYYGGWPYYGYYNYYSAPRYQYVQPAPPVTQPAAPAQTQAPAPQPTTVINNYYYNSSPMSSANALFGR